MQDTSRKDPLGTSGRAANRPRLVVSLAGVSEDWKDSFMSYLFEPHGVPREPGAYEARGLAMVYSTIEEACVANDPDGLNSTLGPPLATLLRRLLFLDCTPESSYGRTEPSGVRTSCFSRLGGPKTPEEPLIENTGTPPSPPTFPRSDFPGPEAEATEEDRGEAEETFSREGATGSLADLKEPVLVTFGTRRGGFWVAPQEWEGRLVPDFPSISPRVYAAKLDLLLWFFRNIHYAVEVVEKGEVGHLPVLPLAGNLERKLRGWVREIIAETIGQQDH